jgi:LytS/YehU family sensor histidine kinase
MEEIPDDLSGLELPGLVLQPIVENAVKHGIGHNLGGGYLTMRVVRREHHFELVVCNTSEEEPDLREEKVFIEGHALKNVDARLRGVYGDNYRFDIRNEGGQTCATLRVPIQ